MCLGPGISTTSGAYSKSALITIPLWGLKSLKKNIMFEKKNTYFKLVLFLVRRRNGRAQVKSYDPANLNSEHVSNI